MIYIVVMAKKVDNSGIVLTKWCGGIADWS